MYTRTYMAGKLYWRVKRNGKWTWRPVSAPLMDYVNNVVDIYGIPEEE